MRLCLACGCIEEHAKDCSLKPPPRDTPEAKAKRVQHAMAEAELVFGKVQPLVEADPAQAVMRLYFTERLLQRFSSQDLPTYNEKRAHKNLVAKIEAKRKETEARIQDGARLVDDMMFAKSAVELLYRLAVDCYEAVALDTTALGTLPGTPVTAAKEGQKLGKVCAEVAQLIRQGAALDEEVISWGWANLGPLVSGREPAEIPQAFMGGLSNYLGVLIGRGPSARRAELVEKFKDLGARFRERLYLLGTNVSLLHVASRLSQSQDAWKRVLAKEEGALRWNRVKEEKAEILRFFLGDWDSQSERVEETIARHAKTSRGNAVVSLRPIASIEPDEWDALARCYFLEFAATSSTTTEGESVSMENVARVLLERTTGVDADGKKVAATIAAVRKAWDAGPPGDLSGVLAKKREMAEKRTDGDEGGATGSGVKRFPSARLDPSSWSEGV
jgi:hypothetical protein